MGWVGSPPPAAVLEAVDRVRSVASGCDVRFHTVLPQRWASAGRLLPSMQSDVLRHAALLEHGGLWLDADVRLIRNPLEWASQWGRYTAVRLGPSPAMIGTDIIFMPENWVGKQVVEGYMDRFLSSPPHPIPLSGLASRMIKACEAEMPEAFHILEPGARFPFSPAAATAESVVTRGFDPPAAMPSLVRRAGNFAASAAKHVAAGLPRATDQEVERRFAICQQCEHFDGKACRQCGCPIVRERRFVSKLSWANEKCPVGKW